MTDDLLEIPAFLDRRRYDENGKFIKTNYVPEHNAARIWAPIKSASESRRRENNNNLYVDNPSWPVQVVTTDKANLRLYDNWEQFKDSHDSDDYPVRRVASASGMTIVVVKPATTNVLADHLRDMPKVYHTVVRQNGVLRPKTDSLCGRAWAIFDQTLTGKMTIPVAIEYLKQGGMNGSTVRTQYAHWRTFNGIQK